MSSRTEIRFNRRELQNASSRLQRPQRQWARKNQQSFLREAGGDHDKALEIAKTRAQEAGFGIAEIMLIIQFLTLLYKIYKMFAVESGNDELVAAIVGDDDGDDD